MKKVVIFGAAQFAELAYIYLTKDSPFEVAAFTVHKSYVSQSQLMGLPVISFESLEENYPPSEYTMFVAVAYECLNTVRRDVYDQCKERGYELITYVNSKAMHWGDIEIGDNCFIFESNVIQPFVKIGNNCIIWSGNHIGHHTHIGDHCFIASHAVISGNCRIGDGCFIGVNATVRDGVKVGNNSVIGAGSLILRDTPENAVYKGAEGQPMQVTSDQLKKL